MVIKYSFADICNNNVLIMFYVNFKVNFGYKMYLFCIRAFTTGR